MKLEELFDHITNMIASPHTTIVDHDKLRAARVFLALDEFMIDNLSDYCNDQSPFSDIDFGAYASNIIDEIENKKNKIKNND